MSNASEHDLSKVSAVTSRPANRERSLWPRTGLMADNGTTNHVSVCVYRPGIID